MANFSLSREFAAELDQEDKLASYREQFITNDPDLIYLDGNSLGRLPKFVIERELPGAGAMSAEQLQSISQTSCSVLGMARIRCTDFLARIVK